MNTAALRRYAPAARKDFLRAVTDRAAKVGLSEGKPAVPVTVQGLDAILDGKPYPRAFAAQRRRLEESIAKKGFRVVMEEAAYTWFNRLMAIRYMEVHGYLDHGFRVLSHPEGKPTPQALEQAQNVVLPGLNRQRVIDLKLDGTKDEELYRMLLLAQCRALHQAMPFLFESIDDATELLVPDHLLASDSLVRKMVAEIPESDWQEIEVVGWLYQFYISEEKARVDASVKGGKAVAPEDIPAKTQLFTPKWIVRYMLQNSLGRLWLDIEPNSPLKEGWEYWVEPAEQEPEVRAELERLAAETRAKHPTPETITFIDPCAGSGHILVEAYDLLKSFYEERGYARREIPRLILEKNLFGLEIDDRAAQMAGFALLMRARADDRSILTTPPSLNVLVLQSSEGIDPEAVASALEGGDAPLDSVFAPTSLMPDLDRQPTLTAIRRRPDASLRTLVGDLLDLFEAAKTFGSLIRVPAPVASRLPELVERIESAPQDLLSRENLSEFSSLVRQAEILARRMDVAVTNPPYLEASKVGKELQDWAKKAYPVAKADLWAMFIERCRLSSSGYFALVTMHAWMFLSTYEELRKGILNEDTIVCLAHLGSRAFREISGEVVQTAAYVVRDQHLAQYRGTFDRLVSGTDVEKSQMLRSGEGRHEGTLASEFCEIPGSPIAYWVSDNVRRLFREGTPVKRFIATREGLTTGSNELFLRRWWEVDLQAIHVRSTSQEDAFAKGSRWFPYQKGGEFRRWFGNNEFVVDWQDDGRRMKSFSDPSTGRIRSHNYNGTFAFRQGITWNGISSGAAAFRLVPQGFMFDAKGPMAFGEEGRLLFVAGFLNSTLATHLLSFLAPTLDFKLGKVEALPIHPSTLHVSDQVEEQVRELVAIAERDWNDREISLNFRQHPVLQFDGRSLQENLQLWRQSCVDAVEKTIRLETAINTEFVSAAGLQGELDSKSTEAMCVWLRPDEELLSRSLLSYAIGVMMGRWKNECGSIDDDGILPVTEEEWFTEEDTAHRTARFVGQVWPSETLQENLALLARGLDGKETVPPLETVRRYLATGFYKDHLQTYKKRPIYWLFSSGKERAFQALVYLHRYNAGTLSRMRMEYVVKLQQSMNARLEQLDADIVASATTSERKRREKERERLQRQIVELRVFDEKLRHYADQRIELDLDDGVKKNYAKFGDLLAESKAITGDKDE